MVYRIRYSLVLPSGVKSGYWREEFYDSFNKAQSMAKWLLDTGVGNSGSVFTVVDECNELVTEFVRA